VKHRFPEKPGKRTSAARFPGAMNRGKKQVACKPDDFYWKYYL